MKQCIFVMILSLSAIIARCQYKPVDRGSSVAFTVSNFGFNVNGTFNGVAGEIIFDPQRVSTSRFDVTIDVGTVNTDNSLRDKHLKEDAYFDVANYPRIRLNSTSIISANDNFQFFGRLTIKGKSKDVRFAFSATSENDGWNFKGSFSINRKDFDIGGSSTISNEVKISVNVHAIKR